MSSPISPSVSSSAPPSVSPLVSIIINNYNYEQFLPDAIASALNQTYPHLEVIAVDDGSTDRSRAVIEQYGDRIIAIFQANGKQGATFNSGFAASKGDIIVFLDADDYLFPEAIERVVAAWRPGLAKVHYRLQVVDTVGEPLGNTFPPTGCNLDQGDLWQFILEKGGYTSVSTSGNALSRTALAQVMPIPDAYRTTADDYLSYQIPFYGEVVAIQDCLAAYRIHTNNQWALTSVTGARFRRFVQHDLQSRALLAQKAQELGYPLPADFDVRSHATLWSRIASFRLDPIAHPIPSDRVGSLIYWGVRSLWRYASMNWKKKLAYSLWFFWVGLMPLPWAKLAITWLYVPYQRPKWVAALLGRSAGESTTSEIQSA